MDTSLSTIYNVLDKIAEFALHGLPAADLSNIQHKRDEADLVSNRDYAMESKIIEAIHQWFPEHTIISEEIGLVGKQNNQHQWFVDPIDGSCNDLHGIPWSSVSVAYVDGNQIMAGMVIHPHTGEVFQAVRGHGATLNGQPLHVMDGVSLSGSVVMTELLNQYPWDGMFGFINILAKHNATVRIMGSSALAIAQVAAGRVVAAVFDDSGRLDVAAGILIAIEAGAVVLKDGKALETIPEGRLIVACPDVIDVIKNTVSSLSILSIFSQSTMRQYESWGHPHWQSHK